MLVVLCVSPVVNPSLKANQNTKRVNYTKIKYCKGRKVRISQQFFHIRGCDMDECRFCYASYESSYEIEKLHQQLTLLAGCLEAIEKAIHELIPGLQPTEMHHDKQLRIDHKQLSIDNQPHANEIFENHPELNANQIKLSPVIPTQCPQCAHLKSRGESHHQNNGRTHRKNDRKNSGSATENYDI
ncbi:hypothetical protein FHG87_008075 [Trinorchestia longiramus]|nr:hypothetical protein FHG87_008075 [Trinorchestia longiramus]